MARHLVLLEQDLHHESVIEEFRAMNADGADFHVVVPVRPLTEGEEQLIELEMDETSIEGDHVAEMAQWRLRDAITTLEESGLNGHVTGEVGRADPFDAAVDALAGESYDDVVMVASRPGLAGWLHLDTASKIQRKLDIPVTVLDANTKQ